MQAKLLALQRNYAFSWNRILDKRPLKDYQGKAFLCC
jgi:hypothetical protein